MSDFSSLSGQLLVSLPSMQGDYFSHTVTLLIEHNDEGAFGLVINKPLDEELSDLLADTALTCPQGITVLESGPVEQNRLFFLHTSDQTFENSHPINDHVSLTTTLDVFDAEGDTLPEHLLAGLGYAGWSGGQLEEEIRADVWLVVPYVNEIVFDVPFEHRPEFAAKTIGIDLNLISPTPGHG
ncbi:MAG: YqgE/AlgH family protein [Pseudomonadales bacterium]|nr:YqgE/AlgH family protein [Pseudomonadales bacterium]MBO6596702.1 YqgE/AlgH family protein [Pseudomonadales bacterium]MBO6823309.1 YqgE/AlgH family protein [Pseudomonadales bacterium]